VTAVDWARVAAELEARGNAVIPGLITAAECAALAGLYDRDERFRSRVVMGRHGFGRGEYKYFSYPLPDIVAALRAVAYPHLAQIANRWHDALGADTRFPDANAEFPERCHARARSATPLLRNTRDGCNRPPGPLRRRPLQVTILLFAGTRFYRRRVCADRTAPDAVAAR
jgi:hypothetical protein